MAGRQEWLCAAKPAENSSRKMNPTQQTNTLKAISESIPQCKGFDDFEHQVFVHTNETNHSKIQDTVKRQPPFGNAVMGTSGLSLLELCLARIDAKADIRYLIVFDRSLRVERFWNEIQAILLTSSKRKEAIVKIVDLIQKNGNAFFRGKSPTDAALEHKSIENLINISIQRLLALSHADTGWLSGDANFDKIRRIFQENCFSFVRLDLWEPDGFKALRSELGKRDIRIDTFYQSNIIEGADFECQIAAASQSLEGLIEPKTLFIDTAPRDIPNGELPSARVRRRNNSPVSDFFLTKNLSPALQQLLKNNSGKKPAEKKEN